MATRIYNFFFFIVSWIWYTQREVKILDCFVVVFKILMHGDEILEAVVFSCGCSILLTTRWYRPRQCGVVDEFQQEPWLFSMLALVDILGGRMPSFHQGRTYKHHFNQMIRFIHRWLDLSTGQGKGLYCKIRRRIGTCTLSKVLKRVERSRRAGRICCWFRSLEPRLGWNWFRAMLPVGRWHQRPLMRPQSAIHHRVKWCCEWPVKQGIRSAGNRNLQWSPRHNRIWEVDTTAAGKWYQSGNRSRSRNDPHAGSVGLKRKLCRRRGKHWGLSIHLNRTLRCCCCCCCCCRRLFRWMFHLPYSLASHFHHPLT